MFVCTYFPDSEMDAKEVKYERVSIWNCWFNFIKYMIWILDRACRRLFIVRKKSECISFCNGSGFRLRDEINGR